MEPGPDLRGDPLPHEDIRVAFGEIEYVPRRSLRAEGRSTFRLVAGILALVFGTFTSMLALSTILPIVLSTLSMAPIPPSLVAVALTFVGVS
ncbi:MAG TPA: hypothetical protein PLQ54_07085, partial [Armatimonadota bacterium]|nr:hypothetical protein [Armatimonadota bacterium]